jgi:hypothetical protein
MWGYGLGMRKAKIKKGVFIGLILAAFLHGLYNFMLTQIVYLGILIIPLMITMWLMMRARVKHALRVSPHREGEIKLLKCPSCGELIVHTNSHFCPVCGNKYEITDELVFACPRCKTETTSDSTQCSNKKCGLILAPVPHSKKIFKKKEKSTDTEKESIIDKLTTDEKDNDKTEDTDIRRDPASWDEGNSS